jgi:hypothetical protein
MLENLTESPTRTASQGNRFESAYQAAEWSPRTGELRESESDRATPCQRHGRYAAASPLPQAETVGSEAWFG